MPFNVCLPIKLKTLPFVLYTLKPAPDYLHACFLTSSVELSSSAFQQSHDGEWVKTQKQALDTWLSSRIHSGLITRWWKSMCTLFQCPAQCPETSYTLSMCLCLFDHVWLVLVSQLLNESATSDESDVRRMTVSHKESHEHRAAECMVLRGKAYLTPQIENCNNVEIQHLFVNLSV